MILTKEGYITSIGLLLPDNSTQQISPADLRTSLVNLADSVHSFLAEYNIVAQNIASIDTRTTFVGVGAIADRNLVGRSNEDNSAFGYHALHGNYNGVKNTAIGATALSCNLYGSQNVAVGFNAIAGNVMGSGNVGIGNFALQTNKHGDFNIAIGHGAGSWVGEDSSYNFYVGARPVDYDDLCDVTESSGIPLLFGDLLNKKLGVGVNVLHDFGTIQSSGDVSPSDNDAFNLGHGSYNWGAAFLSSGLSYPSSGDFLFTRHTPKGPSHPDQYTHSTVFVMDSGGYIGINTETPSGNEGILTVAGNIVPDETDTYTIGSSALKWDGWFNDIVGDNLDILENVDISGVLHVSGDAIFDNNALIGEDLTVSGRLEVSGEAIFDSNLTVRGNTVASGDIGVSGNAIFGNIFPHETDIYSLGSTSLRWDGFFNDLVVTGQLTAHDVNYDNVNECLYDCKTLHLASSGFCDPDGIAGLTGGGVCGYLSDASLNGAGIEVHSSGSDPLYVRDYRFIFQSPDQDLTCLETDSSYARSRWQSNISIEVANGRHVQTQRVLGNDRLALVTQDSCNGLFFRTLDNGSGVTYHGSQDHIGLYDLDLYSYKQDVNFIGTSGQPLADGTVINHDYYVAVSAPNSGISVGIELATRISGGMVGFGLENNDDISSDTSRFSLRTHNNDGKILESLNILRISGWVGVTDIDIDPGDAPIIPATLFNVQANDDCNVRFSADGLQSSSLDIIANGNTRASGVQIAYNAANQLVDFSLIKPSGGIGALSSFLSVTNGGYVGIGELRRGGYRDITPFDPLVISHSGVANKGTIAIREQDAAPSLRADFGKLYVKPYVYGGQTQSIYFLDDGGTEFDLIPSLADGLYTDERCNTYAGDFSPAVRPTPGGGEYRNTTLGCNALYSTVTADDNVAIGSGALKSNSTGDKNIVVGGGSLYTATSPDNNTVIGAFSLASGADAQGNVMVGYGNLQKSLSTPDHCIVIGTGIQDGATDTMADYTLAIGHGNAPLVYGSLSSRSFDIKDGSLSLGNENDSHVLSFSHSLDGVREVAVIDLQDNYHTEVSGFLSLRFTDSTDTSHELMQFDHSAPAMPGASNEFKTATPTYVGPTGVGGAAIDRPFVKLEGDMLIRGAIQFADGTYMNSSDVLSNIAGTGLRREVLPGGSVMHLQFVNMTNAAELTKDEYTRIPEDSFLAISVNNESINQVGKITLADLASYVASGSASVASNCNHVFTNAENVIDTINNTGCVFIGCDVATAATGWNHAVVIGPEAGLNATTPNPDILGEETIETPAIFMGYRAGRDADNVSYPIFIGAEAGYGSNSAEESIYIGRSAGQNSSMEKSIGIGTYALAGTSATETGSGNIEIVAGLLDNQRLMYGKGNYNQRLNIGNSIAGHINQRRISIGDAVVSPDAPLSARLDHAIPGHSDLDNIQTWYCDDERVAYVTCSGEFVGLTKQVIEGFAQSGIPCPGSYQIPTSGIIKAKGEDFIDCSDIYVINRDSTLVIHSGAFVVAHRVNNEYRPIWVSCSGV